MHFVLMFSELLILPIPCLFVLLRKQRGYESLEDQVGTWKFELQASCALDHFSLYPIMFMLIIVTCSG
jgi:hypothetical protein